jgi:hypothetical protein
MKNKPTQVLFAKAESIKELKKRLALISMMQRSLGDRYAGRQLSKKSGIVHSRDSVKG